MEGVVTAKTLDNLNSKLVKSSGPETANKYGEMHQIVETITEENTTTIAQSKGGKIRLEESPTITRANQQTKSIPLQSLTANLQQIEIETEGQIVGEFKQTWGDRMEAEEPQNMLEQNACIVLIKETTMKVWP
ncbi:hypothetical protein LIER_40558 [Lithospermum erythrorhizon]|uniref:Uncharacterized protein n=1 Tax=Lithospermum erythrorhizon TaxID=34254 RepID=A0AAV3R1Y5_LITER